MTMARGVHDIQNVGAEINGVTIVEQISRGSLLHLNVCTQDEACLLSKTLYQILVFSMYLNFQAILLKHVAIAEVMV